MIYPRADASATAAMKLVTQAQDRMQTPFAFYFSWHKAF